MDPDPIALIPDKWQRRQVEYSPKKVEESPQCPDFWVIYINLLLNLCYTSVCEVLWGDRDAIAFAYLDSCALEFRR